MMQLLPFSKRIMYDGEQRPAPLYKGSRSRMDTKKKLLRWKLEQFLQGHALVQVVAFAWKVPAEQPTPQKSQNLVTFIRTWHLFICKTGNSEEREETQSARSHQGWQLWDQVQWTTVANQAARRNVNHLCRVTHWCKLLRPLQKCVRVGSLRKTQNQRLINLNRQWNAMVHYGQVYSSTAC